MENTNLNNLERIFNLQKSNYSPAKTPTYSERIKRLENLDKLLRNHFEEIAETIQKDFGTRHTDWAFTADIYSPLDLIKKVKKNLKKWIKPVLKSTGLLALTGQRNYQINEPLGVIGVMSPFNAPVSLALDPAIEALAAGNSVIIKISESTPKTADLMQRLISEYFDEKVLAVVVGEVEVSIAFAAKPWDLFFFTGGSETGKKILEANAKNLTPSILELGGKSPCILLEDADVKVAAEKITLVRQANAGQICISGDYAFVPETHLKTFVDTVVKASSEKLTHIIDNPHFTSIINDKEYNRVVRYIEEAREAGCEIIQVNPKNENVPDAKIRKIPLTIVVNPPLHLKVAKHEIFGPILTVFSYTDINNVIEQINNNHKPLALYVFGKNQKNIGKVVNNTSSGGVTINDLLMHANAKEMGFGGVGYSGMGRYKGGKVGYYAFTNPKTVVKQGWLIGKFTARFFPPYTNDKTRIMLRNQVNIK